MLAFGQTLTLVRSSRPSVTHPPGAEEAATEHEDGSDSDDPLPGSRGHSPFSSRLAPRRLVGEASASGAGASFPMYVMRVSDFLRLERLTTHNELLRRGLLRRLDDHDLEAHVHFVSHQARATAVRRVAPPPPHPPTLLRTHNTDTIRRGTTHTGGLSPRRHAAPSQPSPPPPRRSGAADRRPTRTGTTFARCRAPFAWRAPASTTSSSAPPRQLRPAPPPSRGSSGAFLQPARTRTRSA